MPSTLGAWFRRLEPVTRRRSPWRLPGAPWWVQPLALIIMPIVLLAEPFSLAVRLFANMTAGHMVMLEKNNLEIAAFLHKWISEHVK